MVHQRYPSGGIVESGVAGSEWAPDAGSGDGRPARRRSWDPPAGNGEAAGKWIYFPEVRQWACAARALGCLRLHLGQRVGLDGRPPRAPFSRAASALASEVDRPPRRAKWEAMEFLGIFFLSSVVHGL
jgi:hypothetical protein